MVIIEAMVNGCPVVVTDAPYGPRDILGSNDYGVLVPVGNSDKLAEAMEKILNDENLRKEYIKKGLKRYNDFEMSNIIKQFDDLMEEL